MTRTPTKPTHDEAHEGFLEIDGEGFYLIPDVDRLPAVPDEHGERWRPVDVRLEPRAPHRRSSDAAAALFPYETDDRLHAARADRAGHRLR